MCMCLLQYVECTCGEELSALQNENAQRAAEIASLQAENGALEARMTAVEEALGAASSALDI